MVIINRLAKGLIFIPLIDTLALIVATAFLKFYVPYHGLLKAIVSDRGL